MDIIYLNDLRVETVIGVNDWERRIKQTVVLDVELGTDIRRAAAGDDIAQTVDYKAVAKRIIEFAGGSSFQLVETLAERLADILVSEFNAPWCRLRLNKQGAVRYVRDVGVVIERGSRPAKGGPA
ncbi:MAG: dihydroneopterin aldolase [Gammaproteobacteria bacterium]|nr:dihydroneopterin aldolase [Gammaproteobacteria bacterium]